MEGPETLEIETNIEKNINLKKHYEKKSPDIICPECKENILIKIEDYKIKLYDCKNKHTYDSNILFKNFENTQYIDISKVLCNNCKISKNENNEFYICMDCKMINLCSLCKKKHDKNHKIIKFEEKDTICNKHYEIYTKYCKECKINICIQCEKEHKNHNYIYYGDILPDNINDDIRIYIDKLNDNINKIIKKLTKLKESKKKL